MEHPATFTGVRLRAAGTACLALMALWSCDGFEPVGAFAVPDSGTRDSGTSDSGTSDSGTSDSGASDSGASDSGASDSGASDSGAPDSGAPDSGAPDSGAPDSGAPDSGTPPPLVDPVTVSVVGDGTVTPDGDRTCDGGSVCAYSALRGSVLGLTATPAANRRFVGWSGACAGSTPRCTAAILGPTSIGAEFAAALRTLALAPSGSGAIAVSPGPTCPGSCSVSFDHGTAVALTAIPSVGHVLLGWGGDCSGSGPGCALTMTADRAASAIFQPSGRYLSVTIVGDGGVSSVLPDEGASILCGTKCGHEYPAPTAVTLSATPGSAQLLLRSWTGCDDAVGNFCELFLNGEGWPNRAVQATFGAQPPGWFDACAQPGMSRFFATPTDDATQTVDLPFQFQLGDLTFNSYAFSTNGLVTFGAEDSAWMPTPLPRAPDAPTPYGVYAFWDDLETSAGNGVCTAVVGAPGGRKAVVTFSAMDFVGSEPPARLTFSVVLAEGTNTVTVLYSEMSSRGSDRARGTGATIGLQAGAFFDQRGYLEPIVSNGTVFGLQ